MFKIDQYTKQTIAATMLGVLIGIGALLMLIGVHDAQAAEDTKVVWACSVQGNGLCGPGQPEVYVNPLNLLLW